MSASKHLPLPKDACPLFTAQMARPDPLPGIGCLRDLRSRALRQIYVTFAWTCTSGFRESLDAACIVMSPDRAVEIISARSTRVFEADTSRGEAEGTGNAVRHPGSSK